MAYQANMIIGRDIAAPRARRVNAGNAAMVAVHAARANEARTYSAIMSLAMFAATFAATFAAFYSIIGG
jgi:hypothetical protein